ncbi:hypothetical protein RZS08_39620, partial [Arthrospira platensis SPKY1]|nr:hypothetical protein [Arthrospira platensis SPKY1]
GTRHGELRGAQQALPGRRRLAAEARRMELEAGRVRVGEQDRPGHAEHRTDHGDGERDRCRLDHTPNEPLLQLLLPGQPCGRSPEIERAMGGEQLDRLALLEPRRHLDRVAQADRGEVE